MKIYLDMDMEIWYCESKCQFQISDSVRLTGPHNSFYFLLLDYGVVGF